MKNEFLTVKKAVFPVAGLGTRFLPATKANPKEMLPIVDKPLIQYAVEEAIEAGITDLVFVTSSSKRAIEDHFDSNFELEHVLTLQGKTELLNIVKEIVPEGVQCTYVRQSKALGLGHAVLCAKNVIGDQPFAVLLADDLIDASHESCLKQMIPLFQQERASVLAVQKIHAVDTEKYGIIKPKGVWQHSAAIEAIVEKPKPQDAPSLLGVVGRYILTPEIFKVLENCPSGKGGELQLTDALSLLLKQQSIFATEFEGKRYDCGSKLGYLQATLAYGLKHHEVGAEFQDFVQSYQLSGNGLLVSVE
ncbi:UTP--glucose-1-phosphate uridylyltransferase GalU [Candidatus Berkiella cookevillensis]|uniref:UTP--glucose-1-phosphate uridylyltransferase n=1 Tax=Candidatus Berkiella cookevillensis TaxID=437022 RepID=A0A0Q9YB05_9GAMM|nr:UTP--glucose-1-phosphate uridylyltransferase GalU [Candidatus Berkiella cookevillensis]MCS5709041.1 UTP--glucose-1-phosphate uridylyltransferase GalU [Candidatus Berkiella cookevillensis]